MHVLGVDRVIIATPDVGGAVETFTEALGLSFGERLSVSTQTDAGEQPVANRLSPAGIEFVTPRSEEGEVARFLEARGPGLYAFSLRVDDVDAAEAELAADGIESVGRFDGDGLTEVFYHPRNFEGAFLILAEYEAPHPMETALTG